MARLGSAALLAIQNAHKIENTSLFTLIYIIGCIVNDKNVINCLLTCEYGIACDALRYDYRLF